MNKHMIAILIIIPIIFGSCISLIIDREAEELSATMDSWVGAHYSELLRSWGAPTRTFSDGRGGQILTYESFVTSGNPPIQRQRIREFFISEDGIIYSWRWRGL